MGLVLLLVAAVFVSFQLSKGWEVPPAVTTAASVRQLDRDTSSIRAMQATDEMLTEVAQLSKLEYALVTQWDEPTGALTAAGFQRLAELPRLTQLVVVDCPDFDDACLAALAASPSIEQLSMQGCAAITADGIRELAALKSLRDLVFFQDVALPGVAALAECRQVTSLYFVVSAADADSLPSFAGMSQLRSLDVRLHGQSTPEQLAALQTQLSSQLPDCNVEVGAD